METPYAAASQHEKAYLCLDFVSLSTSHDE